MVLVDSAGLEWRGGAVLEPARDARASWEW